MRAGKASYCKKCDAVFDPVLLEGGKATKCPKNHPNFMYSRKIPEPKLIELEEEGAPPPLHNAKPHPLHPPPAARGRGGAG